MSLSVERRTWTLLLLALLAVGMQVVLERTRTAVRQRDYALKLAAARKAAAAFDTLRHYRRLAGAELDLVNDPAGTGLIGPEFSRITNARGNLEAKLTSLNPNWAAVMVQMLRRAGVRRGDRVAVAVSGSFPGINIGLYAALEVLGARPVVITSVGSSMWGANDPAFTWLDMERILNERGVLHVRSAAATFGGGDDMGRGLSPTGRRLIREAIRRNGVPLLESRNIEDAITRRMAFYEEQARGRPYRCYVNVGGGVASLGSGQNRILIPPGLSPTLPPRNWPRKGTMILMAERGVPVIHVLEIVTLARRYGLPVAPDYLPAPGEGEIFVRDSYRLGLTAALLVLYVLTALLVMVPGFRRRVLRRGPEERTSEEMP